jgi:hypothetical protein
MSENINENQPLNGRLTLGLVHYPCVDRNNALYTTSVTNLDVHDIARTCRTYGLTRYYLVHPISAQREMAKTIAHFWQEGKGKDRNPDRTQALELVNVAESIEEVIRQETELSAERPLQIATTARQDDNAWSFSQVRNAISSSRDIILWLGTGYGLAPEVLEQSDAVLEPIVGVPDYNHLSVRSAAAIILDRLCGNRVSNS